MDQIDTLVEFIKNKGNGLFAVVNNSGVTDMIAINEMDDDDFESRYGERVYDTDRFTDAGDTGKPCPYCGAGIGEKHGKHLFV